MSDPILPPSGPADAWTPAFTGALLKSLNAVADMDDPAFRNALLRRTAEQLGMDSTFPVDGHNDRRVYINALVYTCKGYVRPADALTALVNAMRELRPDTAALAQLEDCVAALKGLSILGVVRLHALLAVISGLSGDVDRLTIHDLIKRVRHDRDLFPLRRSEDLPELVRRLDGARRSEGTAPPLLVRFLIEFAASLQGEDAAQLNTELEKIIAELGLPPNAAARTETRQRGREVCRVLQIRIEEVSAADQKKYTIDGAVIDRTDDSWELVLAWQLEGAHLAKDIDQKGTLFLQQTPGLDRAAGATDGMTVEFLLPWSLLGHPVEQWSLYKDMYPIGHRFPVVVGSLDRRRQKFFFQPWRERWKMLFDEDQDRPLCDRLGWLHNGSAPIPVRARTGGRFVRLLRLGDLTSWLAQESNRNVASLGLTFTYAPTDPVGLTSLEAAVCEGIPVLIWRRDSGDPNELEDLLADVKIHELRDRVHSWRCSAAGSDVSASDVRRHFVVMWDDPGDVGQSYDQPFMAPQ
jgi:hypothetical protein